MCLVGCLDLIVDSISWTNYMLRDAQFSIPGDLLVSLVPLGQLREIQPSAELFLVQKLACRQQL